MQGTSYGQYDKDRQVAIIWSIEDVQSVRPDLTDEQAMEVLWSAERSHDATVGINWDVLTDYANTLFPETPDT